MPISRECMYMSSPVFLRVSSSMLLRRTSPFVFSAQRPVSLDRASLAREATRRCHSATTVPQPVSTTLSMAPAGPVAAEAIKSTETGREPEVAAVPEKAETDPTPVELPPLSAQQFREYNRLAEHMDYFHNHFRQTWTMMDNACSANKRPAGMSLRRFMDEGLNFIHMLGMHHSIEEKHFFPVLAARMPEFQPPASKKKSATGAKDKATAVQLIQQHHEIHVGMEAFEKYLRQCRSGETDFEMSALKAQMDSWGGVLWQHLDDEVRTLGAENMRKYWTLEELRRIPL